MINNELQLADIRPLVLGGMDTAEAKLLELPQVDCPVTHRFSPGLYIRELFMPAGTLAIGHEQNLAHYNVMLKGKVIMWNEDGSTTELSAPRAFTGQAGRKIGLVIEDMVWQNIYPTTETDIAKLEATYLTKSDTWKTNAFLRFNVAELEHEEDRADYQQMLTDIGTSHELVVQESENEADQCFIQLNALKIRVDRSPIHGCGIFATTSMMAGEVISPARIDGMRTQAGRYANHSLNPNAWMFKDGENIFLVARRDIEGCKGGQNGEEITIDYRQAITENKEAICQESA